MYRNKEYLYNEYIVKNRTYEDIAKECGIGTGTLYYHIKKHGLNNIKIKDKITSCNEDKFDIDNPIFCYYAGIVAADGYIQHANHRVSLRMKKDDWYDILVKLKEHFECSTNIGVYQSGSTSYSDSEFCDLTISSKKLILELEKLDISKAKKELSRRFPQYGILNNRCLELFMRGLIDGDGSIRPDGQFRLLEESMEMMKAIQECIFNEVGIYCNIYMASRPNSNKRFPYIAIRESKAIELYEWIYQHDLEFKLQYKYDRYLYCIIG